MILRFLFMVHCYFEGLSPIYLLSLRSACYWSWLRKVRRTLWLMKSSWFRRKEFIFSTNARRIYLTWNLVNFWSIFINCRVHSIPAKSLLRFSRSLVVLSLKTYNTVRFDYLSSTSHFSLNFVVIRLYLNLTRLLLIQEWYSIHCVSGCYSLLLPWHSIWEICLF